MELLSLPQAARVKLQPRVKSYKADLDKMKKDARRLHTTLSNSVSRAALLSRPASQTPPPPYDPSVADADARTRLLSGTSRLEGASRRLEEAHRIALETESMGVGTLGVLREQREQIVRTRDT
ncbi:hypothetical protein HDU93_004946, partial [Gonapodya sp. JEL0774]